MPSLSTPPGSSTCISPMPSTNPSRHLGEFVDLNGKGNDSPSVRWLTGEDGHRGGAGYGRPAIPDQPDR